MLSNNFETGPRVRSLPMSTSQPPGNSSGNVGPGVIAAPTGKVGLPGPPQVSSAPPTVAAPGPGQLAPGMVKNGPGIEEEVGFFEKIRNR